MSKEFTKTDWKEVGRQLSCPSGKFGVEVGENMNQTNIGMIESSIDYLALNDYHRVLELGHGNCGHLKKLLSISEGIQYHGLEVSQTMWDVARKANASLKADFKLYDGETIPYPDDFFDRIMSVNTIYFWSKPGKLLNEMLRVLKPEGFCVLTFADKEFMKELPFVKERFKLYDKDDLEKLAANSGLMITSSETKTDAVKNQLEEQVFRPYTIAKLKSSGTHYV